MTLDNILRAISEEKYKFDHHSLTVKTYAEAIFTLSRNNGEEVDWSKIDTSTDKTFKCNNSTFRLYGIDYNKYFNFKHKFNHKLRDRIRESFLKITGLKSKKVRVSTKNKIWLKALIIISVNKNWIIFVK